MSKKINRRDSIECIGPNDPRWDKMVKDFMDWYIEDLFRHRRVDNSVTFLIDIDMKTGESITIIGQTKLDAYLRNKRHKNP